MTRRSFLVIFPIFCFTPIDANPLAWIFRGFLRTSFRTLGRSGVRYTARAVGRSVLRTGRGIKTLSRIRKTFGKKIHKIKNRDGKVVGSAKVEGNVLMIRDTQKRILGYIQSEKNLLSVYNGAGKRVIAFREKDARIIAYDKDENYIGQIVKKEIKGQLEDVFMDALGNEHSSIPLELQAKDNNLTKSIPTQKERLEIFNNNHELILYGVKENNDLILYDTNGTRKAKIKRANGKLYIYNNQEVLLQTVLESEQSKIEFDF